MTSQAIRILFVDDDGEVIDLLRETFKASIDVNKRLIFADASDGEEALKVLARTKFDLVVLDLSMPKMNGIDVLQNLRTKKGKSQRAGVIIFSGFLPRFDASIPPQILENVFFLEKPCKTEKLQFFTKMIVTEMEKNI